MSHGWSVRVDSPGEGVATLSLWRVIAVCLPVACVAYLSVIGLLSLVYGGWQLLAAILPVCLWQVVVVRRLWRYLTYASTLAAVGVLAVHWLVSIGMGAVGMVLFPGAPADHVMQPQMRSKGQPAVAAQRATLSGPLVSRTSALEDPRRELRPTSVTAP